MNTAGYLIAQYLYSITVYYVELFPHEQEKLHNLSYGRRNPPKLTFIFNESVTINERTLLNK